MNKKYITYTLITFGIIIFIIVRTLIYGVNLPLFSLVVQTLVGVGIIALIALALTTLINLVLKKDNKTKWLIFAVLFFTINCFMILSAYDYFTQISLK